MLKCPKCGSNNLIKHGTQWRLSKLPVSGTSQKVQRYRCNSCGRFTVDPKEGK